MIGLKNFRSLTNIENGRHPLSRRLAARIEAETGASALSLMNPQGVPLERWTKRPFSKADYDRTRAYYLPSTKRDTEDEEMFEKAVKDDATAYGEKMASLIRCAHRRHKLFAVLATLDYMIEELAEDFGLTEDGSV